MLLPINVRRRGKSVVIPPKALRGYATYSHAKTALSGDMKNSAMLTSGSGSTYKESIRLVPAVGNSTDMLFIHPSHDKKETVLKVGETVDFVIRIEEVNGASNWGFTVNAKNDSENNQVVLANEPYTTSGVWAGIKKLTRGSWSDFTSRAPFQTNDYPLLVRVRAKIEPYNIDSGTASVVIDVKRNASFNWENQYSGQVGVDGTYYKEISINAYCRFRPTLFSSVRSMYTALMTSSPQPNGRGNATGTAGKYLNTYPRTQLTPATAAKGINIEFHYAKDPDLTGGGTIFSLNAIVGKVWTPLMLNYHAEPLAGLGDNKGGILLFSASSNNASLDISGAAASQGVLTYAENGNPNMTWVAIKLDEEEKDALLKIRIMFNPDASKQWCIYVNDIARARWSFSGTPHLSSDDFTSLLCSRFQQAPTYRGHLGGFLTDIHVAGGAKPTEFGNLVRGTTYGIFMDTTNNTPQPMFPGSSSVTLKIANGLPALG